MKSKNSISDNRPAFNRFDEKELFQRLMFYSENIINFYEPVYENDKIIDFKVIYFNETTKTFWKLKDIDTTDKYLSELFPRIFEKEIIPFLSEALISNKTRVTIDNYLVHGSEKSLKIIAQPTLNGILTTFIDVSENHDLQNRLAMSGSELEDKVHELESARFFSQSVLDSSNNIITFFLPLFNEDGIIIDFKIEYINERIEEAIGKKVSRIIGRKFSEFYPNGMQNGDFQIMVDCFSKATDVEMIKDFSISGSHYYFSTRILKLENGLVLFSKDITKERRFEEELAIRNRMLNRAEKLSGVGSFRWNIETGHLTYSDNYFRLLGFKPQEFQPSYDNFLQSVHPSDLSFVESELEKFVKLKSGYDIRYRVLLQSGKVKTVTAVGQFYQKSGQQMMIGAVKDITDDIEIQLKLHEKNIELEQSNHELASFNRVASHDLQEPLRKIQMFTSRILEEEAGNMSARGITFLEKISSSSERMRSLIQNLLSYSKLADESDSLKKVDLNIVLQNVLNNLDDRILETEAEIIYDTLPVIFGVEFQLEQVLINLISNALKYRKLETPTKITIKSKIVKYSKIDKELQLARSRYLILEITDNGIGFEEKFNTKIFGMFQRLHTKNEYSGTGLGLSICQKIIQNHKGHIKANAIPGKGATFTLYLPFSA